MAGTNKEELGNFLTNANINFDDYQFSNAPFNGLPSGAHTVISYKLQETADDFVITCFDTTDAIVGNIIVREITP